MNPVKKQARIAGLLYALVALMGPLSLVYIPSKLFVHGDVIGTADRLLASAPLVHWGIASELLYQSVEVFLVLVLYALFEPVNKTLARQMAVLGFMSIPIVLLSVINEVAALTLVSGSPFLAAFGKQQLAAMATLLLIMHGDGLQVAAIFWGLWLFPFGLLIIQCGFIPRALGVLVMIAGVGYLLGSIASLALGPAHAGPLGSISGMLEIGEPPIILWLLFWGAKTGPSDSKLASIGT
jgi:hypothetical protein